MKDMNIAKSIAKEVHHTLEAAAKAIQQLQERSNGCSALENEEVCAFNTPPLQYC